VKRSRRTKSRRTSARGIATKTVKCLSCSKKLKAEVFPDHDPGDSYEVLYDGLWCRIAGNYGSSVFDPIAERINGEQSSIYLEFALCDDCVRKNARGIKYVRIKKTTEATTDRRITLAQYESENKSTQELWKKIHRLDPARAQALSEFLRNKRRKR
jgi:hypothetical protein